MKTQYIVHSTLPGFFTILLGLIQAPAFAFAEPYRAIIPDIPGIEVQAGESVLIPSTKTAMAFLFTDGRIAVGSGAGCSYAGGAPSVPRSSAVEGSPAARAGPGATVGAGAGAAAGRTESGCTNSS